VDVGEAVVAPYLWASGTSSIDRLLVTHAHPDHAGGAPFLLRHFGVSEAWEGPAPRADAAYARLAAAQGLAGTRRTVRRGLREVWDGVEVEVLWPAPTGASRRARNDDSVVLRLRLGQVALLLPGDLEKAGEGALEAPPAAVLKVPPHGSRTSSSPRLLDALRPRVAIASAGFRNRYGHPHPEVVERYRKAGIELFRTDRDGAVTLSTDGSSLWVSTFRDPRPRRLR
jgi:competence protein ComEC